MEQRSGSLSVEVKGFLSVDMEVEGRMEMGGRRPGRGGESGFC